jgi:protease I
MEWNETWPQRFPSPAALFGREQTVRGSDGIGIAMKNPPTPTRVAILVADGFEQIELEGPRAALKKAGLSTEIVSPNPRTVKGVNHDKPGRSLNVDRPLSRARPQDYDALLLPGGVMNPDSLRQEPKAVRFVQAFFKAKKPVAAICHGPQMLIEADVVKGRRLTSFPSVKTDLGNAGARWVNRKVVVDRSLVTSRKPADIPAFNVEMLKAFGA